MNKAEFLQALETGLAAATPEERAAALQYYTEYLDEAGPEREAEVLDELGSPDKVAADILGSPQPQAAGAWTPPTGQPQGGWVPPEAPHAPEPPPQWREGAAAYDRQDPQPQYPYGAGNPYGQPQNGPAGTYNQRNNSLAKIIVIILAAIVIFPLLGGFSGVLIGVLAALFTLFLVPIIAGAAFVAAGVIVVISGVSILGAFVGSGLLTMGIGVALFGLGLLCLYGGGRLLGKLLPAIVRGAGSAIGSLWNKFTSVIGRRA